MRSANLALAALLVAAPPLPHLFVSQQAMAQGRFVEREVVRYTVRSGDTMSSIARSAGIPLSELRALNPNIDPRFLRVGQTIYLPSNAAPTGRLSLDLDQYRGRLSDEVVIRASGFTPGASVRVMAGDGPYRLEPVDNVRADRRGRIAIAVDLPDWARAGQQIYFGLQSRDGRERVVARPYEVVGRPTRPDRALIEISGTMTRQGVECPTMRGDDGRTYSLLGEIRGFRPGDRVAVEGRVVEMSICQQGISLDVRSITSAD